MENIIKKSKKVNVYVDGYNLYFGMKAAGFDHCKWLDVLALSNTLKNEGHELGTIKTERRDINYEKQKGGFIVINLRVKDSTAYIHATCGLDMTFTNNGILEYRVENKGMKGSIIKDAFEVMNQLALSFSKPITYNKTR